MSWTDYFDRPDGIADSDVPAMVSASIFADTDVPVDMRDLMYWCRTPGRCDPGCSCHWRIAENRRRQWMRDGYRAQRQEMR